MIEVMIMLKKYKEVDSVLNALALYKLPLKTNATESPEGFRGCTVESTLYSPNFALDKLVKDKPFFTEQL